jgi:hypothetical protein
MSTITIQRLYDIPALKQDRLMNSAWSAYSEFNRKCGGCGRQRRKSPTNAITLLKAVSSKHRDVIIAEFGLDSGVRFSVFRTGTAMGLRAET